MDNKNEKSFRKKHPILNTILGIIILLFLLAFAIIMLYFIIKYLSIGISQAIDLIKNSLSKLDAVIVVALITGTVSLTGVIISSIVSKRIEYKKSRQEYLAQKREHSYGAFVEMVYKIQQNSKKPNSYTTQQMIKDMSSFSQELTLWGSKNVVNKWVEFRTNGADPDNAQKNLFLLEEIMNEMRKDMGVKRVKKGNLLSFFVNNIKDVLRGKKWKQK